MVDVPSVKRMLLCHESQTPKEVVMNEGHFHFSVVYFNEFCITSCYGWHTVCDTLTKRCVCLPGYSLSPGGINCVLPGKALLDEACREGCFFEREQFCLDGTCKCMSGLRPMTDEEIRAFNNPDHQCIEESFSLGKSSVN